MNALESLDGFSRVWSGWMLPMVWQVAFLVLILSGLTWFWRRKSAVLLHTLWLLVLVRLVLPPAFAFPTGWAFWLLPAAGEANRLTSDSSKAPIGIAASKAGDRDASRTHQDAVAPDSLNSGDVGSNGETTPLDRTVEQTAADKLVDAEHSTAVEAPVALDRVEPGRTATAPPARSWSSTLMLAWAGVAATLLVRLFWGSILIRRWVREAEPIDDPDLYSLLEDCRQLLGITRLVELRNSESCTTPVVAGVRRPVILLPKAVLSQLNSAEMRAVLLHELNHIARGDAVVNLLQGVLGCIYFFHPLVWWANACLRRLREEACDELTVAALDGERRIYGEALVKVTEIFGYASPPLALGVLESKSPARIRLGRILDPRLPQGAPFSWKTAATVLLLAAVLLPGAGGRTSAAQLPGSAADAENKQNPGGSAADDQPVAVADPSSDGARSGSGETKPGESKPEAGVPPFDGLRYRWEASKTYAYRIQIEADEEESIETLSGTPTYTVRSTGKDGSELVFNGRLMSMQKFKPQQGRSFGRPPRIRSPFSVWSAVGVPTFPTGEHVLQVNDQGDLQSMTDDSQLPYFLGNLSQLVLVPLGDEGQAKWDETEKTSILLRPPQDDRFPFPRPRIGPFANRDEGERLEARQKTEFRRDEPQRNTVAIHKKYELKTTQTIDGQPRVELAGETEITFDLALGLPTALAGKYRLTNNSENTTRRTPITISAKLLSEEERAQLEAEQKEAVRRQPLDDAALDEALADLQSGEASRVQNAAAKLERAEPQDRLSQVARALEPLLEDKEKLTRQAAARALAVWCDYDSVPVLIAALKDDFFTVPWAALETLGKLRDDRAIDPIIGLLKAKKHRQQAIKSLAAMGTMVEDAALALLEEDDSDTRHDACQVLKEIGGKKSLGRLGTVSRNDSNGIVKLVADQALKAIRERNP